MVTSDTIAALSSAAGPAARMIVRASGPAALRLADAVWASAPEQAGAYRGPLRVCGMTVPACWLYVFRAPRSYTGEDLVEFHIPGNPLLARMLLDALAAAGARGADPGEFTARAYFNGRIDLTEAEGVAATIAAGNEQELRAARQLLAGELARRLQPATDLVAETLALVEVGIDFVDEDVTVLSAADLTERVGRADGMLRELLDHSARFERLTHEPRVVLVGRPNAGKSTLLNALAGHERAVTSPVAGTTRDVLTADVPLARGLIKLTDAAGVEGGLEVEHSTAALADIGQQMRGNALRAVESADVVVLVRDIADERPDPNLPTRPDLLVLTKSDLRTTAHAMTGGLSVSAHTGEGLDQLRDELDKLAFGAAGTGWSSLALNARHIAAVTEARDALARVAAHVSAHVSAHGGAAGAEFVALELREALNALGRVTGVVTPDDLLGRVFSAFCIGK